MPNWCANRMSIRAVTPEAQKLLDVYKQVLIESESKSKDLKNADESTHVGFFSWFLPMPENPRLADGNSIFDWNRNNWGTKWDIDVSSNDIDGDTLTSTEDTAWSPPVAFYEYMSNNGFEVEAGYYEPGSGFYGRFVDGYDDEDTIPAGTKDYHLLKDASGVGNSTEIKLVEPIDFASVKTGDVLTTAEGTIIYVEHRKVLWKDFEEDNEAMLTEDLMEWDNDIREVMDLKEDFYVVKFIRDASRAGTETGTVFAEHLTSLEWVDD